MSHEYWFLFNKVLRTFMIKWEQQICAFNAFFIHGAGEDTTFTSEFVATLYYVD